MNFKENERLKNYLVIAVILLLEILFFYNVLLDDSLLGNRIDGKLTNYLCDHWFRYFSGKEDFGDFICFYPAKGTFSYSDLMLAFFVPYGILRLFGMGIYAAFKWAIIIIHTIGSYTMYYFMRKHLKFSIIPSVFSVICFSFSNPYYYAAVNLQMFAQSLLPVLLIFVWKYYESDKKKWRHLYGILSVLWIALLFYTAFYVGYFLVVFILLMIVIFCVSSICNFSKEWWKQDVKQQLWRIKDFILYGIVGVIVMLPFVLLYLPTLNTTGGRTWDEVLLYSPSIRDLFMQTGENILGIDTTGYHMENGFPILGIGIFIFLSVYYLWEKRHEKTTFYIFVILISVVIGMLFPIKIGRYSLWWLLYKYLPGASGIRATARVFFSFTIFVAILFAFFLEYLWDKDNKATKIIAFIIVCLVYILNFDTNGVTSLWNESDEIAFEQRISSPPEDCDSFIVSYKSSLNTEKTNEELQMDAWTIALKYNVPTINGYSGQSPEGWLMNYKYADFEDNLCKWVEEYQLENVYVYDMTKNTWTKIF